MNKRYYIYLTTLYKKTTRFNLSTVYNQSYEDILFNMIFVNLNDIIN